MIALIAAAAVLVPASADAVLAVEHAAGVRALLEKAGAYAPSLSPQSVGATLKARVGVDLLAAEPGWGLSAKGTRLVVFSAGAMGLNAPVRDLKTARKQMAAWVAQDPRRVARISRGRLFTASGRGAQGLLTGMERTVRLSPELSARAQGPVWLWARLEDPLRATLLTVEASAIGIVARGLITATGPLLAGPAPSGCASGIACLRAGVAEAGRSALGRVLARLGAPPQPELAGAARVEERIEAIDVRALSDGRSLGAALPIAPVFGSSASAGPSLDARVDLGRIDAALATLTPFDAIRGGLAAGAYAIHALYGELLRNAGPLTISGSGARGNAANIELRLPLRPGAPGQGPL